MLVTLTISVVMAAMIAYLTSLGVLVFSLEPSSLDPTFNQFTLPGGSIQPKTPVPELETANDREEFFFLRTNLQVLIHNPDDIAGSVKRFQFLSILETHTLRNLLSGFIGLWVIPTLWTIVRTYLLEEVKGEGVEGVKGRRVRWVQSSGTLALNVERWGGLLPLV